MIKLIEEIFKHVDGATFGAGVVFGIALTIAAIVVTSYVQRHWRAVLILCAVVTSLSLFALAW